MAAPFETETPGAATVESEARAVAEIVTKHLAAEQIYLLDENPEPVVGTRLLLSPAGTVITDLETYLAPLRLAPRRRTGTAKAADLLTFCALVDRYKDANSAVFAHGGRLTADAGLLAVLNYNPLGGADTTSPRHGDHRVSYKFPMSQEWQAWAGKNSTLMDQAGFAAFLEERISDVIPGDSVTVSAEALAIIKATLPEDRSAAEQMAYLADLLGGSFATPARLIELSRGLSVREGATVKNHTNLSTGESTIVFENAHTDEGGKPLQVPSLFMLGIPMFEAGPLYRVAARLRYRVKAGGISWHYQLYRPEAVFRTAFDEACHDVAEATGLPVYRGTPEGY